MNPETLGYLIGRAFPVLRLLKDSSGVNREKLIEMADRIADEIERELPGIIDAMNLEDRP